MTTETIFTTFGYIYEADINIIFSGFFVLVLFLILLYYLNR